MTEAPTGWLGLRLEWSKHRPKQKHLVAMKKDSSGRVLYATWRTD